MKIIRCNKKQDKFTLVLFMLCAACISLLSGCGEENKTVQSWPTDDTVIRLYQHETDNVAEMTLEEYLCGVVAGEMDNTWPQEALKAQAILARTFTLEMTMLMSSPTLQSSSLRIQMPSSYAPGRSF